MAKRADLDDLVEVAYRFAERNALEGVLGLGPRFSDRRLRKALSRYQPASDRHESAASDIGAVAFSLRFVAHELGGDGLVKALNKGLGTAEWTAVREQCHRAWPVRFTDAYPELQLDVELLSALAKDAES